MKIKERLYSLRVSKYKGKKMLAPMHFLENKKGICRLKKGGYSGFKVYTKKGTLRKL